MSNVNQITNQKSIVNTTILPWLMWSLAALFYAYRYILDVFPGVAAKNLMLSFHADATMLGYLAAFYLYAYAIMQIPIGILLDRFGPRRLVTFAAAMAALGCLIFAAAKIFAIAALGRLLTGFGVSFAIVSALYVAATWLPAHRYAFATGLIVMIGMLGAACGETPVALLLTKIDWRNTLLFLAVIGLFLSGLLYMFIQDPPKLVIARHAIKKQERALLTGIKKVLKNQQSWLIAIYGGLMFMPTIVFGSLWGVPFISQRLRLDNASAAGIITMIFLGWAAGAPFFGWFSDKIKQRKPIMLLGSLGAALTMAILLYSPIMNITLAGTMLLLFGFFSGGFLLSFSVIREIHPQDHTGAATGFMNTLNMVGGAIGQPLVGVLLDWGWHGVIKNGVHFYSLATFQWSLLILPIAMALSALLLIWIKETYPMLTSQ